MGYEVHITRADEWTESEAQPITLAEWLAYVNADPKMRLDRAAEVATPTGETLRYENEGLAVWSAYCCHGIDEDMAWFDYRNGRIVVKSPDEEIRRKMYSIALQFSAQVQGDEGERYDVTGNQTRPVRQLPQTPHAQEPRWKRILALFRTGQTTVAESEAAKTFAMSFQCGARVQDAFGNQGTVVEVDPRAEHGLGRIRIHFDDGQEVTVALMASGLELLTKTNQDNS